MNQLDLAHQFLEKARDDQVAMTEFADSRKIADHIVGFHAQQVVEKSLKAVLASRGVRFPWVHDVRLLIDMVADAGVPIPEGLEEATFLTTYAVDMRYPGEPQEPLDRQEAVSLVARVSKWAEEQIGPA